MKVIDWKPIKSFDGYFINELGEVKSTRAFKGTKEIILKSALNSRGYKSITMLKDNIVYTRTIHKILGYCASNINMCCNGKRKTAHGYVWRFVNENNIKK